MDETVRRAVARYHDLLSEAVARESSEWLADRLARRGLVFGGRPLCTVVRPRFLSAAQHALFTGRVALLLRAFATAHRAALADPAFRAQFGLAEWEEELVREEDGLPTASPVGRFDTFVQPGGGFQVTEYNAETPAGAGYVDVLAELFLALPAMRAFAREWRLRPLPARPGVANALLDTYMAWRGRREVPTIGILDWREVPTYSEFLVFADYFHSLGIPCVVADPRECEFDGGRLVARGVPVDLVYKRVLVQELVTRGGMDHPVVRAVRRRAVLMLNPFRCKILHKKASLAVLTDERNAHLFGAAEREAIAAHVPWTRRVEDRWTEHRGRRVDLVPYLLAHRERFVLKPNDDYGGAGIVLGWEVDAGAWEQGVALALASPYVAQERMALPTEPYPAIREGALALDDRIVDTSPYCCHGAYMEGCLTRISTASLVNVTAGGGSTVPTFVVEER